MAAQPMSVQSRRPVLVHDARLRPLLCAMPAFLCRARGRSVGRRPRCSAAYAPVCLPCWLQVHVESLGHSLVDQPSSTLLRGSIVLRYSRRRQGGGAAGAATETRDSGAPAQGNDTMSLGEASRRAEAGEGRPSSASSSAPTLRPPTSSLSSASSAGGLSCGTGWHSLGPVQMALVGQHQTTNVATAVACCLELRAQGWSAITDAAMQEGLAAARLPGRVQVGRRARQLTCVGGSRLPALRPRAGSPQALAQCLCSISHNSYLYV